MKYPRLEFLAKLIFSDLQVSSPGVSLPCTLPCFCPGILPLGHGSLRQAGHHSLEELLELFCQGDDVFQQLPQLLQPAKAK